MAAPWDRASSAIATTEVRATWHSLPQDVLHLIFSLLAPGGSSASTVCKQWNTLCWRCLRYLDTSFQFFCRILRTGRELVLLEHLRLDIDAQSFLDPFPCPEMPQLPNLSKLKATIDKNAPGEPLEALLELIGMNSSNLRSVLLPTPLLARLPDLPKLEEIILTDMTDKDIAFHISRTREMSFAALQRFRTLRKIRLHHTPLEVLSGVDYVRCDITCFPYLEEVDMRMVALPATVASADFLQRVMYLAQNFPHLRQLEECYVYQTDFLKISEAWPKLSQHTRQLILSMGTPFCLSFVQEFAALQNVPAVDHLLQMIGTELPYVMQLAHQPLQYDDTVKIAFHVVATPSLHDERLVLTLLKNIIMSEQHEPNMEAFSKLQSLLRHSEEVQKVLCDVLALYLTWHSKPSSLVIESLVSAGLVRFDDINSSPRIIARAMLNPAIMAQLVALGVVPNAEQVGYQFGVEVIKQFTDAARQLFHSAPDSQLLKLFEPALQLHYGYPISAINEGESVFAQLGGFAFERFPCLIVALIRSGANPNDIDHYGNSILHRMALEGFLCGTDTQVEARTELLRECKSRGIDLLTRNRKNHAAVDFVSSEQKDELIALGWITQDELDFHEF